MISFRMAGTIVAVATAASLAVPASATVTTFATFNAPTAADNFRLVNSGNSSAASRTSDAVLYTTSTGTSTVPGSAIVRFSFLQTELAPYVTDVNASLTFNATIARGTPAQTAFGQLIQQGITGSFSFLTTSAITVGGPDFLPHTYAAGSNLLSGTFSSSTLFGSGSSAATSASTQSGLSITFTSDFLDFSQTAERDLGLTLTSIDPSLLVHAGANKALNSFRARAGGQFSSDPAPLINGLAAVPEPATWSMLVFGFGVVGGSIRRSTRVTAFTA